MSLRAVHRIVRAPTLNSDSARRVCSDIECVSDCSALPNGCSELDHNTWIAVFFGFGFVLYQPIKLGMHKMELGDSVYAAERIMKKRIRKVSFISSQNIRVTDSNLAKLACEITYQAGSIGALYL